MAIEPKNPGYIARNSWLYSQEPYNLEIAYWTYMLNSLFGFLLLSTLQDTAYGSEKGLALISGHTDMGDGGGFKWSPHKPLDFEQLL